MTKDQLQKELKEKVREGVKPSDIKKLKRSKSDSDIPKAPPLPTSTPLSKSKSSETSFSDPKYPYTTLISQQEELEALRKETQAKSTTISLLRKKIDDLEQTNPDLDNSLLTRHKNLKDWFKQYQRTKELDKELKENIDQASNELLIQDQTISSLRTELRTLKHSNQSLQRDLELVQRLAESRKTPLPSPEPNWTYLKLVFYSLLVVMFTYWMLKTS